MSLSNAEKISLAQLAIQIVAILASAVFIWGLLWLSMPRQVEQGPPIVAEEPPK